MFKDDIDRFVNLVRGRLERVAPAAIQSLYRVFLDAEPVWTGALVFNYTFSIGSPASGTVDAPSGAQPPIPRGAALSSARALYRDQIPETVPLGETLWITNNLEYAQRIEEQGSPRGWGQGVLALACSGWPAHVKLGIADAIAQVRP